MRIGIDLDEVVADSIETITRMHNEKYGTSLKKEDFTSYHLHEILGESREETKRRIDEFFDTDTLKNINPVAGSMKALAELKRRGHELYIVTARPTSEIEETERWLKGRFPNVFKGVHYANLSPVTNGPDVPLRKKSDICKEFGLEVMVDDNLDNAFDCAGAGIKVLLLDEPWNQGELGAGIQRVKSWEEIEKIVG